MKKTAAQISAKAVRAAAASVRGARSMGIVTRAAIEAPALLARARKVLARLEDKAAEDRLCGGTGAAEAKYQAFSAAVDELAAELGEVPEPAQAKSEPESDPEPEIDPAIRAVAVRVGEDPHNPALKVRETNWYDRRGMPVVQVGIAGHNEGHTSSIDGSCSGGCSTFRSLGFICADGQEPVMAAAKTASWDGVLWTEGGDAWLCRIGDDAIYYGDMNKYHIMDWSPRAGLEAKEGDRVVILDGFYTGKTGTVAYTRTDGIVPVNLDDCTRLDVQSCNLKVEDQK